MRRTGRVIAIFLLILSCMAGLWIFQSWKEAQNPRVQKTLRNVYVTAVSGDAVTAVSEGESITWNTASAITGQAISGIADLHLQNDKIVKIVKKPEEVKGKILKIAEQSITLEEYGEVKTDQHFVVYRISREGVVSQGKDTDLIVGASDVRFVAAGKYLCAAVIPESELENIRVLLKNNAGSSYEMDKVIVTANVDFTITQDKQTNRYAKGEKVTLTPDHVKGRVLISTGRKGKIRVESLKRQQGVPEYRGELEVEKQGDSLQIVNELPLEEYLYSVVPSEMPTEYSIEALKAQAVCARSYAVQQMKNRRLAEKGAHVDDSVSFQVYNNLKEDAKAIEAVNATRNQVVAYQGKVAATYFFSASCGSTSGTKDVWFTKNDVPYLTAALQTLPCEKKDLTGEQEFVNYIKQSPKTVDSSSPWYRWQATISAKNLQKSLEKYIQSRYQVNPTQIQVKEKDGTYRSRPIKTVGAIQNITVQKRGAGGVVSMIEVTGENDTVRIYTEYNIRMLLVGENTVFQRQDKKKVTGLSILPSGFFYIEKKGDSYIFRGGGYGHGVGMSQNGANTLAGQGKKYNEILTFYFPGTNVQSRESL